ncbi:MAG: EAL domain-containing protein, partial [Actinobacteria bacterium]|nr:EAL domain-containing protein [Actinomycetota bacterium]
MMSGLVLALPDAVLVVDMEGVVLGANPAAEELFGVTIDERVGVPCFDLIHSGDLEMALVSLTSMGEHEIGSPIEIRVKAADGWRLVEVLGAQFSDEDIDAGIILAIRDLTDRRKYEIAQGDEAVFRALMQNAVGLTVLIDPQGTIETTSVAITRALGYDPPKVVGTEFGGLVLDADRGAFEGALARCIAPTTEGEVSIEVRLMSRDGTSEAPYQLVLVDLVNDPSVGGVVVTGHEISELRAAREELARLAYFDGLTGLPNRAALITELESRLRPARGERRETIVAFLDLDRFKPVNDLFGHAAGDELLTALGRRLEGCLRATDYVSRFGGDEFVVLADPTGDEPLSGLVARLENAVAEPFSLSVGTVQVYASIGVATANSGDDLDFVMAEADAAMYAEKHRRRGVESGRSRPMGERRALAESIDRAFDDEEFELWYQPIVDLGSGRITSFESLIRWRHPERGLLSPAAFLDIVEDLSRDDDLAEFVLASAVRDMAVVRDAIGRDMAFAVNASASQFTDPQFATLVRDTIAAAGIETRWLTVEVSERSILERPASGPSITSSAGLAALAATGVRIAVDDFGTGYSSLSHLVSFPIDSIKVDRSFVSRMTIDRHCMSVVSALVGLAMSMDIDIVAEGIETPDQLNVLIELGCHKGQGFLMSRPVPLQQALELIETTGGQL